jgi:hypothetical protein
MTVSAIKKKLKASLKPAPDMTATVAEIRRIARPEAREAAVWQAELADGKPFAPNIAYWEAFENLRDTYDPRALPFAQRAMRELAKAHRDLVSADIDAGEPYDRSFVNCFQVAREAAQKALFRDPPSREAVVKKPTPAEQNAQKVPLRQIAALWRWKDETGNDDIARVLRELDHPGSELTAEVLEADYQWILGQLGFVYVPSDEEDPDAVADQGPAQPPSKAPTFDSIEALVRQRCLLPQIISVKASELGIDAKDPESAHRIRQIERAVREVSRMLGIDVPANSRELTVAGHVAVTPAAFSEPTGQESELQEV